MTAILSRSTRNRSVALHREKKSFYEENEPTIHGFLRISNITEGMKRLYAQMDEACCAPQCFLGYNMDIDFLGMLRDKED